MAKSFKLNRYFTFKVEMGEDCELEVRTKRLSATDLIDYTHEIGVLQDRLEKEDKTAVKDIYLLNIDLLNSQVVELKGLIDEDGNEVKLPETDEARKDLFNDLGIDFINKACNKFAEGIKVDEKRD